MLLSFFLLRFRSEIVSTFMSANALCSAKTCDARTASVGGGTAAPKPKPPAIAGPGKPAATSAPGPPAAAAPPGIAPGAPPRPAGASTPAAAPSAAAPPTFATGKGAASGLTWRWAAIKATAASPSSSKFGIAGVGFHFAAPCITQLTIPPTGGTAGTVLAAVNCVTRRWTAGWQGNSTQASSVGAATVLLMHK